VTWGLPSGVAVFLDDATALQTSLPGAELERWVLASYPDTLLFLFNALYWSVEGPPPGARTDGAKPSTRGG
jgi:hypothetical protein